MQATAMAHRTPSPFFRSDAGVAHKLHERAPKWTVRRRCADGLDGLSQLAHDQQGAPVSQLLGMISAGHVAIGNVHGSNHLRRVLHEVITIIMLGQRLLESCTL